MNFTPSVASVTARCGRQHRFWFVFWRSRVRNSAWTPAVLRFIVVFLVAASKYWGSSL